MEMRHDPLIIGYVDNAGTTNHKIGGYHQSVDREMMHDPPITG